MNHLDALLTLLAQIEADGYQPSIALLKSRSAQAVPLPALINAVNHYKQGARASESSLESIETPATITEEPTVAQLQQQINLLQQRIDALEAKLS